MKTLPVIGSKNSDCALARIRGVVPNVSIDLVKSTFLRTSSSGKPALASGITCVTFGSQRPEPGYQGACLELRDDGSWNLQDFPPDPSNS